MASADQVIPRGLLILDAGQSRLYLEQEKLKKYYPQFQLKRSWFGDHLSFVGTLKTMAESKYKVRIALPEYFPDEIPSIEPVGWNAKGPHVYASGNLCIMKQEQWRPFYSVAFIISRTAIWLNKFDVYTAKHYWPGNEQPH
jgi:ubiquitin-protein ligase